MTGDIATQDLEDDGSGFNPIEFARRIYSSIRPLRSQLAPQPERFIESPAGIGSGSELGENLPNAFFRMLGLPATRSEEFLLRQGNEALLERLGSRQERDKAFSQDGTLNYFALIAPLSEGRIVVDDIKSRNNKLSEQAEASDYNKMMSEPLLFNESLKPTGSRRASLFPLVVDATLPVYPLSRRMAPLFNDGDYEVDGGKTRVSRPFLEHVIYIRSKALSGSDESEVKQPLIDRINALRPESKQEFTDITSFSDIELIIQQRFLQCLKRLAFDYLKVQGDALRSRQKVKFVPNPVENPEERSGQGTLPAEDEDPEASTPGLDRRLNDLKLALAREEAIRFILPTEIVNRSDKIRRLSDPTPVNNYKDDVLISDFINLITYKEEDLRRQIADVEAERNRAIQEAEKIKRDLVYFTGEFTGLSIFDIIGVLYGLFTVEIKYLVGLLNNDAQQRLLDDPFFAFNSKDQSSATISSERNPAYLLLEAQTDEVLGIEQTSVPSVTESLIKLQEKVKEAFLLAQTFASQDDRRPVRRRRVTCR